MVGIKMKRITCKLLFIFYAAGTGTQNQKNRISVNFYRSVFISGWTCSKNCSEYSCWILKEHPDDFDLVEWVLFDEHTELVYAIEVNAHNKGI